MKHLLVAILLMASTTMWADKYNYLTVSTTGEEYISLPTIQKITFADGNCIVTTTKGDYTYPLSEIKKMYFSEDPDAIKSMPQEAENLKFKDDDEKQRTLPYLRLQLKALVARDLWDMTEYFQVMNEENHIVQKGLEVIKN